MNNAVTSKEAILEVSRELIRTQGWAAANIRAVAASCGVSVGSIYNYFGSKSELSAAIVESVWQDIFHFSGGKGEFASLVQCMEWIFRCMEQGAENYPGFFTFHSMGFLGEDTSAGKQLMEQSWEHIRQGLFTALQNDKNIRPDAFGGDFTPETLIDILFSLVLSALLRQDYSCHGILELIRRAVYSPGQ